MTSTLVLSLTSCLAIVVGCAETVEQPPDIADPDESGVATLEDGVIQETGFTWCAAASPRKVVSRTVSCTGCNQNDVEACARSAANSAAIDVCEGLIPNSGGDAACGDALYQDDICVDDDASGVTSSVHTGSETACGTWPFRHAKWRVTYQVSGDCGYFCRD